MCANRVLARYEIPLGELLPDCFLCSGPHRTGYDVQLDDDAVVCVCLLCVAASPVLAPMAARLDRVQDIHTATVALAIEDED